MKASCVLQAFWCTFWCAVYMAQKHWFLGWIMGFLVALNVTLLANEWRRELMAAEREAARALHGLPPGEEDE